MLDGTHEESGGAGAARGGARVMGGCLDERGAGGGPEVGKSGGGLRWLVLLAAGVVLVLAGCATTDVSGADAGDGGDVGDDVQTEVPPIEGSDSADGQPIEDVAPTESDDAGGEETGDGEPTLCASDEDCEFQTCVPLDDDGAVGVCSDYCDLTSDCPEGFQCALVRRSGADAQRVCLPTTFCLDRDGDGYGVGPGCDGPDCDDQDPDVNPGRREWCDGKDTSCSGVVDDNPQYGMVSR